MPGIKRSPTPAAKYTWSTGGSAQAEGEAIEAIRRRDGEVTREAVVKAARPKRSPLHRHLTWDDTKAAHLRRLDEAGWICRHLRVVYEPETEPERVMVSVLQGGERSYLTKNETLTDDDLRLASLREALSLLKSIRDRFAELSELDNIFTAIDRYKIPGDQNGNT